MDDKYREHIVKNVEKLIGYTDYDKFMHACVYSGLLTHVMRRNVEVIGPPLCDNMNADQLRHERHRRLFIKLTKRGPDAYQRIKNLLSDLNCESALQLLNVPLNDDNYVSLNPRNAVGGGGWSGAGIKTSDERTTRVNGTAAKSPVVVRSQESVDSKSKLNDDTMPELVQFTDKIEPRVVHVVQKSTVIHVDPKVGIYQMKTEHNRGVLFMVNIIDFPKRDERRNGAEEDSKSLLHLFKELGFKLFAYENLTKHQFFHLLDLIIDSKHTRDAECFVMALMTHGSMEDGAADRVQFHDGSVVKVREIEDRFENTKCLNLVDKPKIFIFPFCRGDIPDYGHYRPANRQLVQTDSLVEKMHTPAQINIPTLSDIFICHASSRGFMTHRDPTNGSWYIEKFCEMMAKHAHDTAFDDIVKIIQTETSHLRTLRGAMQTGSYSSIGFNKKLFFNPGVWDE